MMRWDQVWFLIGVVLLPTVSSQATITPSTPTVLELGESVTLTCTAPAMVMVSSYQFFLNNVLVQNTTNENLTITYTNASSVGQGGAYSCRANDDSMQISSSTEVLFSPTFIEDPVSVSSSNGSAVQFNCTAVGSPQPTIEWHRLNVGADLSIVNNTNEVSLVSAGLPANAQTVLNNGTNEKTIVSTLTISPVMFNDFGDYVCLASPPSALLPNLVPPNTTFSFSNIATLTVSPLNSVDATPVRQTVDYNGDANFTCSAMGGPDNMFRWIKGSTPSFGMKNIINSTDFETLDVVSTGPVLALSMANGSTGGEYTCVVFNDAGFDSDNVTLYVSPRILTEPQDQFVQSDNMVTLTCIADSFPAPEYQWEVMNRSTLEFGSVLGETTTMLTFNAIEHEDFGTYRCVVTTPTIDESVNVTALITVSPANSVTTDPSPSVTVNNSDSVTLQCSASGGPYNNFTWIRTEDLDGIDTDIQPVDTTTPINIDALYSNISNSILVNDRTLTLTNVNGSDGGNYTCLVFNNAGVGLDQVTVYVSPIITTQPVDTIADNGSSVSLQCVADSFPDPEYQWQRLNNDTMMFEEISMETRDTLTFNQVEYSDAGTYRCIVTTPTINEEITSDEAVLTVSPLNSVSASPVQQTVEYDGDTNFTCSAMGGPDNTFRWIRGSDLSFGMSDIINSTDFETLDVVSTGPVLALSMANGSTGGEYTCVVFNDAGFDSDNVTLYVSPQILTEPRDQFVQSDNMVTLTCIADSFPAPEYQWEVMNRSTSEFGSVLGETTTMLTFNAIEHEDFGTYRCVVTTPTIDEIVNATALITVSPANSLMIDPSPSVTVNNSNSVTLQCSASGGPYNNFTWIRTEDLDGIDTDIQPVDTTTPINIDALYSSISNSILANEPTLTLSNVNGSDGGNYTCLVFNNAGVGLDQVTVYVTPIIIVQPMNTIADNGSSVSLQCVADSFPDPEYQWERLNENMMFEEISMETGDTLAFDPVEYSDAGTYRCMVTTPTINEEITSDEVVLTVSPLNSVSASPVQQTVEYDGDTNFTCTAMGGPNNMFRWIRGSDLPFSMGDIINSTDFEALDVVSTGPVLALSMANGSTGGEYTCVVFNDAGFDSDNVTLYVSPRILTEPQDQFVQSDSMVTLTCIADSFPAPEYQWEVMNRSTSEFGSVLGETTTMLTFNAIEHEDFGTYRCVVTTPTIKENVNATALITVSPADSVAIDPSSSVTVNNSDSVTLQCSASGGPYNNFTWIRTEDLDGIDTDIQPVDTTTPINIDALYSSISNSILVNDRTLTLTNVNGSDGGNYTCLVFNNAGVGQDQVTVYVTPIIITQPVDTIADNSTSVSLRCVADSFPDPEYQWQRLNDNIMMFEDISMETEDTLTFDPVEYSDAGIYRCVVTTPIINEEIISDEAVLTVSPLNSVDATPVRQTVEYNGDANFSCSAVGGPNNVFRWIRGSDLPFSMGDIINSTDFETLDIVGTGPVLALSMANGSTGGEYTCVVFNDAGFDSDNVTLYVSPRILTEPQDQFVQSDSMVTLTCIADSFPAPEYQWEVMNRSTSEFGSVLGETTTMLTFNAIEHEDFGTYRCVVTTPTIDEIVNATALITVSPADSVAIDPSPSVTVNNSDSVTLQCSANGGPYNNFTWIRTEDLDGIDTDIQPVDTTTPINIDALYSSISSSILANDPTLTLSNVNGSDGGNYTCLVFNNAGVGQDQVTVYITPIIIVQPMNTIADNGSSVSLRCVADSFPDPEYQWQRLNNDTMMFEEISMETGDTLTFNPVEYSDAGTYQCIVTTPTINEQITSNEAVLTVSPNNSVTVSPRTITVDNGSSATFTCRGLGSDDNYFTWLRSDGLDLDATNSLFQTPLNITSVFADLSDLIIFNGTTFTVDYINATEDGGSYTCLVFNVAGFDSGIGELFVNPVVTIPPQDMLVEASDTVTLTCFGDSFNRPQYQWEFMNRTTQQFETIEDESSTDLLFPAIDYEEYGMYRCVVLAVVADDSGSDMTVNATSQPALITVSPRGSVTIDPQIENSFNGSSVTLTCSARGGPDNTFQWTYLRTGAVVSTLYQYIFIADIYTGGEYQCTVTNEAGNETDNATVNVGPIITEDPQSINVTIIQENIILTCTAIGVPEPSIIWTHNGSVLNEDGDEVASEDGLTIELFDESVGSVSSRLIINSALANHTGEYYCNATSSVDFYDTVMSDIALVLVQDIPDTPENLTAVEVTSRNVTLTWQEPHDNNAPILNYTVFYTDPSFLMGGREQAVSTQDDTETLQITGLHPGQEYNFTVTATNEEGESEESQPLTVRTLEEVPSGFPQNLNATTLNSTAIELSWEQVLENEANGIITQYRIIGVPSEDFADAVDITVNDSAIFSVIASGLEEFVVYNFTIRASTAIGFGPSSPGVTAQTDQDEPSGFPQNLTAVTLNSTAIEVSWDEVLEDEANGIITQYNITGVPDATFASVVNMVVDDTVFMVEFVNLEEFVVYSFTISASTEVGFGPSAPEVTARTDEDEPSGFPRNLTAVTLNSTAIEVSWDEVLEDEANGIIAQYNITGVPDATFASVVNMVVDDTVFRVNFTDLEEFVVYRFTISASTEVGFGPSSPEATARTDEAVPFAAPRNFTVTDITADTISLEWVAPVARDINGIIDRYIIRYQIVEQLREDQADIDDAIQVMNVTEALSTVLTGLDDYTVYNISIAAVTIGEGPVAILTQRTDENAPGAPPRNLTATTNSTTSIIVRWVPPVKDLTNGIIDSYEIRYGRYNSTEDDIFRDITNRTVEAVEDVEMYEVEITELEEFIEYGFQVRAVTIAPGPYSNFTNATTFQAPPRVAVIIDAATAVPEETREATSVRLTWDPIPPDDANGELTYNVSVNVRGLSDTSRRRKRQLEPNSQVACLLAANITSAFSQSVPGDQTSLTLDGIAPNTLYFYTVTGVTDAGTGPTSMPVNFSTPEGVPTAPRDVTLTNTSSTSLQLEWVQPICDNGNRTGYTIMIRPLDGPNPGDDPGKLRDGDSVQTNINVNAESQDFTGLSPNSAYEVIIGARTRTGIGINVTINQTTTEDAPEAVNELAVNNETSIRDLFVSWLSPSSRNGSFNISLTYTATQVFIYSNRVQNASGDMNIFGAETENETVNITLPQVLPYALYTVRVTAFNRLFGMSLSRESVIMSAISQPIASSAVVNVSAVGTTATSVLVQWEPPLNPNGPINYYRICINGTTRCNDTAPNVTSYSLTNLPVNSLHAITIQPVTVTFNGVTLMGDISGEVRADTNTLSNVTGPDGTTRRTTDSLRVTLPSYTAFGGDVVFYGVIVTNRGGCGSVTDYGQAYPDPMPIGDGNNEDYYIAAGWADTSMIPSEFTAGGGGETTAFNPKTGREETYTNPSLDRESGYCIVAFVYLASGVPNEPIVRYVPLATAETRLGYNRGALGFFMALLILILIIAPIVIVVVILHKKYGIFNKSAMYSMVPKRKKSEAAEAINGNSTGPAGTDLVIINKKPVEDSEETRFVDPSSSKEPIHVKDFPAHVANMHSNDDYLFSVEYPTVEPRHAPTTEATHHPDNAVKNRYANITAYDHSRVRLQEIPNVPGSDYINACFIDGYKAPNTYIASQGPVPHSVVDFWRMVWEQNTATIVMLTNLEEKGRVKCSMYWPPPNKRVQVHGLIRVQLQEELHLSDHTIRTLSLQKEKGDERIVKQFHYTAWPDFGVPEHPTPLLRFIRKVESGNPANAGPMIVHCSAGVGRTGTFVTISTQIKRIKDVETINVFNFVQSMRYRRCFMVQTEAQYIFIHDALLEVIECGETEVSARELKDKYRKLSTFNDTEGLMNIEIEYERIQETIHTEPIRYAGTLQHNRQKNRFHNVIPFDKTRCRLSAVPGVDGSDYVNANFIEGYLKGKAFVATQGPLPDTSEDFWRMVWEYKSSTIIMLAKEREGTKVMCHRYWPDETTGSEMHGHFEISLVSVREYPDYILREIKIVDTRDQEGSSQHIIKQFHYTGWPAEGVPTSAIGLLDIREQVEKWQRNSGDRPIIAHCSGGCGRTGSYISMCLLIDRLKTEGVIDVFQTVRGLRLQRPGMVRSVEQYDFVYKGILEYLGSFDNYANFSL